MSICGQIYTKITKFTPDLGITMPFYASVVYSLGALLARKASVKARENADINATSARSELS